MLRRDYSPIGGYGWPPPPVSEVRARWARWLGLLAVAVAVLALVTFVIDHDDARPGLSVPSWLVLLAAAVLLVVLSVRYRAGGAWPLARTLAEYATAALLAVLLTLAATGVDLTHPPGQSGKQIAKQQTGRAGAATKGTATGAGCPAVLQVPAWLACLWRQANPPPSTKPKQGQALPSSPAPPARRTIP